MTETIRVLDNRDVPELDALLATDPVRNLFVASRIRNVGLDPAVLGCAIYGRFDEGKLISACHAGANLVPINIGPGDLDTFARIIGSRRATASIMGDATQVMGLHASLVERWGRAWGQVREIRAHQPLLVIDEDPVVPGDPRVHTITEQNYGPYLDAAVAMYTEEVGISPMGIGSTYRHYVRNLIHTGRAMGAVHGNRVWFKSDVGAACGSHCQIQGVWLHPQLRGRGLSEAAMSQAVRIARRMHPIVSLYVNDFNAPARALYTALGFRQVGEFATILY